VEWSRVHELLGAACRSFYDSLANSYLGAEPPIDPGHLFSERGELFGGCTCFDFRKAASTIQIRRPSHWPPPQMWREGDSPEEIRHWNKISRDINADIRLGPDLEAGWLNECISGRVTHWRPQFERRFAEAKLAAITPSKTALARTSVAASKATNSVLASGKQIGGRPELRLGKQKLSKDPIAKVKETIRGLKALGLSQLEICQRLKDERRPKNAAWKTLTWPAAFRASEFRTAVKSWISRVK
jgi:hypothetical protein